jgi:hypothetical protein
MCHLGPNAIRAGALQAAVRRDKPLPRLYRLRGALWGSAEYMAFLDDSAYGTTSEHSDTPKRGHECAAAAFSFAENRPMAPLCQREFPKFSKLDCFIAILTAWA